ncbi:MAG: VacJ family lipoprotein [Burkholderiales bacterium]|jgi:phospholipid-binding lipoprotein MlaA|nr:VacJ family lipoprotein [Burkholderiales bacterium]
MALPEKSCVARLASRLAVVLAAIALVGCAATGPRVDTDPLEPLNRATFAVNDTVDRWAAKPIAQAWEAVVPDIVQRAVRNFFNNIDDIFVVANDLLQLKGTLAAQDGVRLAANTVFGVFGLYDIASARGIPKRSEDFGQTLGWWGVPSGPYLMLPLLGPSSMRDGPARLVDTLIDPVWRMNDVPWRNSLVGVRAVDARASVLPAEKVMNATADDRYAFLRNAWLARRQALVDDDEAGRPSRRRGGAIAIEPLEDPGEGAVDDPAPAPAPKR